MEKKLYRLKKNRIIGGVCAGLAEYFKIDVVIVRIIFVILALGKGIGILAYIILMIAMPEQDGTSYADEIKKNLDHGDKSEIKQNIKEKAEKIEKVARDNRRGAELGAAILIVLGVFFLLNNIAPVFFSYDRIWPLAIIALGIAILVSGRRRE